MNITDKNKLSKELSGLGNCQDWMTSRKGYFPKIKEINISKKLSEHSKMAASCLSTLFEIEGPF